MIHRLSFCLLALTLSSVSWADSRVKNSKAVRQEIAVNLFGQRCKLSGPFSGKELQAIHSISPEQIGLDNITGDSSKVLLEKIQGNSLIPHFLNHYKDKVLRKVKGTLAFYEGLTAFKSTGKTEALTGAVDIFLEGKSNSQFKAFIKTFENKEKVVPWSQATLDQIKANYFSKLGSVPEEAFHRSIEKSEVFYTCAFEETDSENSASEQ